MTTDRKTCISGDCSQGAGIDFFILVCLETVFQVAQTCSKSKMSQGLFCLCFLSGGITGGARRSKIMKFLRSDPRLCMSPPF